MKTKKRINISPTRFLEIRRIPIVNAFDAGLEDHLDYPYVNGVMLVPLRHAHKFNLSSSTLRKKIKAGKLTAYEQDGTIRAANARTDIYWNPYSFYNND